MFVARILQVVAAALAVAGVAAHVNLSPDEKTYVKHHVARTTEALSSCLDSQGLKDIRKRMVTERSDVLNRARKSSTLNAREFRKDEEARQKWSKVDHEEDKETKDVQELFDFRWDDVPATRPALCITTPENIHGPYWKWNHTERMDIRGEQQGIYVRLAMQVIDVTTCMPLEGARVDVWQANATGVYSDTGPSWLRGYQQTSDWGTVEFDTIFPGHYGGRNTHTHVNVWAVDNSHTSHSGQIFFDEELHTFAMKQLPYSENKNQYVDNLEDEFVPWSSAQNYDPYVRWSWLGNDHPNDGFVAWIAIGVNQSDPTIEQPKASKRSDGPRFFDTHLGH